MTRGLLLAVSVSVAMMAFAGLTALPEAAAEELLENGDFESLPGGWSPTAGATRDQTVVHSGSASWLLDLSDGDHKIQQTQSVSAGSVTATAWVAADTATQAALKLTFIDASANPLLDVSDQEALPGGTPTFTMLALSSPVPTDAAYVTVSMEFKPAAPGTGWVDSASLVAEGIPVPTPTYTATPTFTPTPTTPTATPTKTPHPTSTPKPGGSATSIPSSTPTSKAPTPVPTQSPAPSTGGSGPPGVPSSGSSGGGSGYNQPGEPPVQDVSGGLLLNGSFEATDGSVPSSWAKYGGTIFSTPNSHGGSYAVSHLSQTDSTKWIYQVVPVTAGNWYEFSAWALRESGDGEAFLRLSFYQSGDGSGSTFSQADSTTTTTSATWTLLSTGPVQAPIGAQSVRARLMIRPAGLFSAAFDDASLFAIDAPAATPTTTVPGQVTPKPATTKSTSTATVSPTNTQAASKTLSTGFCA